MVLETIVLWLHILSAVGWLGAAMVFAMVVAPGLASVTPQIRLVIRTPRPWRTGFAERHGRVELLDRPIPAAEWGARFRGAHLRVVTGSRTLLEALEVGGPFLYFNGVLGRGSATRRHRPEKIVGWLEAEGRRLAPDLRRDLADFARARRVREVVRRAARAEGGWARFPTGGPGPGFRPPFDDAGRLIEEVARALARDPNDAPGLVLRVRKGEAP